MRSLAVGKENLDMIEWDENYFKFCDFENISIEGGVIGSDFIDCSFKNVDWYWGLFSGANFVNCLFNDCVFRGSAFPDGKFVECSLVNCRFIQDNLTADCDFSRTIAYRCSTNNGEGFKAEIR
jgi:uncharacterized protein YjbI with pentapeptide repeats